MITIREKDNRFFIKESTQPDAGLGLFASVEIKKGDHLEIIGVMVDKDSVSDVCTQYANTFKFAADYSDYFDKHIIPMGFGGMVNHANDKKDQNVEIKYIKKNGQNTCVYSFIKTVNPGDEVLGDYGENWRAMMNWAKETNSKYYTQDDEKIWNSFLKLGLYNLEKLKKYEEKNAPNK